MTEKATVLLAGASGVFGKHLRAALTHAGYQVMGLGRGADQDFRADLLDREALLKAVDGHRADIVIHAATALRKPPMRGRDMAGTNVLRVTGTRNLVAAARELGATRFMSESIVFGYGFGDQGEITEDSPFGVYQGVGREVVEALRIKEELTFGFGGVSLRYGLFYGPGGTEAILDLLRKRMIPYVASHGRTLAWVDLRDAAQAMVQAIELGVPGTAYNIVDDTPMGFGEHIRAVADAYHLPKPLTVPLWLTRPMSYAHTMLTTDQKVSNRRAKAELSWTPRYPDARVALAGLAAAAGAR